MYKVDIYFQDGTKITVSECEIEENIAQLIVYTGPDEKSVIPLGNNVRYYDVEVLG